MCVIIIRIDKTLETVKSYFSEQPGLCSVGECKIELQRDAGVVNLPSHSIPVRICDAVDA